MGGSLMSPARVEFPNHPERPGTDIEIGRVFTEITRDKIFVATGTDTGFSWVCVDPKNWKRIDAGMVDTPDTKTTPNGAVVIAVSK